MDITREIDQCEQVVVHANCGDGAVSALIADALFGGTVPIIFAQHGSHKLRKLPLKKTLFVDMVPESSTASAFRGLGSVVLDHHVTSERLVKSFEFGVYRSNMCGAQILASFVPSLDRALQLEAAAIGAYDLFNTDSLLWEHGEGLALMLQSLGEGYGIGCPRLPVEAERRLREIAQDSAHRGAFSAWDQGIDFLAGGKLFRVVSGPQHSTTISGLAARRRISARGYDALAAFRLRADGSVVWSLRALAPDVDVSKLAQSFNGGGHKGAAGFRTGKSDVIRRLASVLAGG